jgi:hypothetical protein
MAFRIFAAGVTSSRTTFNYERSRCPDDDVFSAADVASALRASGPGVRGAAEGVADYVVPSDTGAYRAGVQSIAKITFAQLLDTAVGLLAAKSGASEGWISVAPRLDRLLLPNVSRIARYSFSPGDNPGAEFIRTISPALRDTDMHNWGTLRQLAEALGRYELTLDGHGTPMIQIQLFK